MQGDIADLAGSNILKTQLDTGGFEMVTLQNAVKNSGTFDVTLGEAEGGDDEVVEDKENNHQGAKSSTNKCDQGTQTELISMLTVAGVVQH